MFDNHISTQSLIHIQTNFYHTLTSVSYKTTLNNFLHLHNFSAIINLIIGAMLIRIQSFNVFRCKTIIKFNICKAEIQSTHCFNDHFSGKPVLASCPIFSSHSYMQDRPKSLHTLLYEVGWWGCPQ